MTLESAAELVEATAAGAGAARLLYLGLSRYQPGLLCFLVFIACDLFALSCYPPTSSAYFYVYVGGTALNWLVCLYAVREILTLSLANYPGIRSAGRWAIYVGITISLSASLAITGYSWNGGANGRSRIFYLLVANRSVLFTLAVVVIVYLIFISRYPLHLQKTTYVSCGFFGAVFLSEAAVQVIDVLGQHLYFEGADTAQIFFAALCFAGWALMLGPAEADTSSRVSFSSPHEHELLLELESLNRLLARSGRR